MQDISEHTVLIVDDTVETMDMLVAALGRAVEVMVAMDGQSALAAVFEEKPDLILLDIEMPDMDGYEVMRRLKTDPETATIPIVFLSARSGPEDRIRGLRMGARGFIAKPFTVSEVLASVTDILTGHMREAKETAP